MTEELTKVCTKCGRELPLSEYHADKSRKDGLNCWCKLCINERNKLRRETHPYDTVKMNREDYICVKTPTCPRVGNKGAHFELFICEICGTEFRRRKSKVDYMYEHMGCLPRFCSKECMYESMRKSYKSKYEKEIERIKKET